MVSYSPPFQYWFFKGPPLHPFHIKNVSLEMLRAGYATLYESGGAEYEGMEKLFRRAEKNAQKAKEGMWGGKGGVNAIVRPEVYKKAWKAGSIPSNISTPNSIIQDSISSNSNSSSSASKIK